jgi:hypothetical protein
VEYSFLEPCRESPREVKTCFGDVGMTEEEGKL